MTVQDLINELSKHDPTLDVFMSTNYLDEVFGVGKHTITSNDATDFASCEGRVGDIVICIYGG